MYSCEIKGGLGNQLFQIFATLAHGIQTGKRVIFPYYTSVGNRFTYWTTFFKQLYNMNFTSNTFEVDFRTFRPIGEPTFRYQPLINSEENLMFTGYLQSPMYFPSPYLETIEKLIGIKQFQTQISEEFSKYFSSFHAEDAKSETITTVSMHFRLGDYKEKQQYHALLSPEYYSRAFEKCLQSDSSVSRVLYFCETEDIPYVHSVIQCISAKYEKIDFVRVDDNIEDWKQMLIMSLCTHNIIANSTFSWWGAFFNKNSEKQVYYPQTWFGPMLSYHDIQDLFPSEWIKIQI